MAFWHNVGEDVQQGLVRANQECGSRDAPHFLPIHVLFLHHAKLIADFLVYISKECIRQVVFGAELGLGFWRVSRDSEHHRTGGLKLLERVAESAGFNGAARSISSGIKEEYNGLAGIVREAYALLLVGFEREVGNFLIQFHGEFPRKVDGGPVVAISLHYSRGGQQVSSRTTGNLLIKRTVLAAVGLLAAVPAWAQYPGQVKKSDKEAPELRAVAVLEWTGDEGKPKASRIVPITVFDGLALQDGGVYLARPEPMAVDPGVEYVLQQDGHGIGLYDIDNAGQEAGSWVGLGTWKPMPTIAPKRPAPVLAQNGMDDEGSDHPTLHRKHPSGDSQGGGSSGSGSGGQAPAEDPDRPTLHKKTTSDDSGTSGSNPTSDPDRPTLHKASPTDDSSNEPAADPDRPTLKKTKDNKQAKSATDTGYVEDVANDADPNRPRLARGKSTGSGPDVTPTLLGLPPDIQQAVAVSDAKNRPEHLWSYTWSNPDDEGKMKANLEDLARTALGLNAPPPPPARKTTAATTAHKKAKPAPPPPPAPLPDEQFRVFELAYSSGATLVLTAHTGGPLAQQKFVTLIAQPDLYGSLRVLFKSVTDGAHLDEAPRMRLIDAVDALADNRGELLFELRGSTQRQFALYRVLRGTAERLFITGGGQFSEASGD